MAGSIFVPIKTIYNDAGAKAAQKSLSGLGKSFKSILGGLGVGLSIGAVVQQLEQATKAAAQDVKSQAVLANTLRNVAQASDTAIASSEKYIRNLQMQVGIADDELRPVFGRLVSATGDLAKSQDLLAVAADLAASKNIDLSTAGNALAKAVSGQTTALFRLAPELKKSSDFMATLRANTAGAAEIAANNDPFQRLTVIFGEMQEQVGMALLPAMQSLAKYVASEEFQTGFSNAVGVFTDFINGLGAIGNAIVVLDKQLDGFWESLSIPNIDLGWVDFIIRKVAPIYNLFKSITLLGKSEAEQARLNAGSGVNTNSLAGILAASGGTKTAYQAPVEKQSKATKQLTADTSALTKAVAAAKAAFDAKVKAYQDAVAAANEVIASTKEMTAEFVKLFAKQTDLGQFEQNAVSAFENIYQTIKDTLAKGQILKSASDSLTKYADTTLATLRSYARQQDALAQKIDIARTITSGVTGLANLTGMLDTITESVTQTTRTMANGIETIITKTFDVTKSSGLVDNFQKLVDKTKAFATNLISLKKLGLNKNLFAQLVNAGADAGGATAQAIVDGGSDTISALNDLYGQLDTAAASIAETSTQTLYEVGQAVVTNGFIEGLVSQAEALATAAASLAQTFADAFNAQLAAALQVALPAVPMPSVGTSAGSLDLTNRPDPNRSPQRYAAWLAGIGGIDPIRSPQSYAAAQKTYNITLNTGVVTNSASVGQEIVTFIQSYERASGSVWQSA